MPSYNFQSQQPLPISRNVIAPITTLPNSRTKHMSVTSSGAHWAVDLPIHHQHFKTRASSHRTSTIGHQLPSTVTQPLSTSLSSRVSSNPNTNGTQLPAVNSIDIALLREKSRHLDLPLISALCNDRSLLKQTKAFVMSKHHRSSATATNHNLSNSQQRNLSTLSELTTNSLKSSAPSVPVIPTATMSSTTSSKNSMSVGLSATTAHLTKTSRSKTSISHRHPNDKLPPLPMQMAEANTYVIDPAPSVMKHHKSYNAS